MSANIWNGSAFKESETPKSWNGSAFADTDGYCWEGSTQKEAWGDRWIIKNGVMQEPFKSAQMYQAPTGHNYLEWNDDRTIYTSNGGGYGGSVLVNTQIKGVFSYLYVDFTVLTSLYTSGVYIGNCTISLSDRNTSDYDTTRKGVFADRVVPSQNYKFYTTAVHPGTFYFVLAGYQSSIQYNNILVTNKVLSGYTYTEPHQ